MSLELRPPVKNLLDDDSIGDRVEQVRRRMRRRRPGRNVRFALGVGLAAVVAAIALIALYVRDAPEPRLASIENTSFEVEMHRIAEGVEVWVSPSTRLDIARSVGRGLVTLTIGRVLFDIQPSNERWTIVSGDVRIGVIDTRFSVERLSAATVVEVERGIVEVESGSIIGGRVLLEAGQNIRVGRSREPASVPDAGSALVLDVAVADPPRRRPAATRSKPSWLRLMEARRYEDAYAALGPGGIRAASEAANDPAALLKLSDLSRRLSRHEDSVVPLARLVDRYPESPDAAAAAFTHGKVALVELRRPVEAIDAFTRALQLKPSRTLEEELYVRLVQANVMAGRREDGRRAQLEYRARFAGGRYEEEMERWLSQP